MMVEGKERGLDTKVSPNVTETKGGSFHITITNLVPNYSPIYFLTYMPYGSLFFDAKLGVLKIQS
jgi:hypothetical protein